MKLSDEQEMFCREYLIDLNATQAAIRAGYSENTATQSASRLLTNVNIQVRIQELTAERIERTNVDSDFVISKLEAISNIDVLDFIRSMDSETVIYKNMDDFPDAARIAIKSIKATKDGIEITFYDKLKALEMISRHIGLFNADQSQTPVIPNQIKVIKNYDKPKE